MARPDGEMKNNKRACTISPRTRNTAKAPAAGIPVPAFFTPPFRDIITREGIADVMSLEHTHTRYLVQFTRAHPEVGFKFSHNMDLSLIIMCARTKIKSPYGLRWLLKYGRVYVSTIKLLRCTMSLSKLICDFIFVHNRHYWIFRYVLSLYV